MVSAYVITYTVCVIVWMKVCASAWGCESVVYVLWKFSLSHFKPLLPMQLHWLHIRAHASLAALPPGSLKHVYQQVSLQQCRTWYGTVTYLLTAVYSEGNILCVVGWAIKCSSSGPRVFMSCPLDLPAAEVETWFINLWNHFVIPYLMGTIMAGIEVCGYGWVCGMEGTWVERQSLSQDRKEVNCDIFIPLFLPI